MSCNRRYTTGCAGASGNIRFQRPTGTLEATACTALGALGAMSTALSAVRCRSVVVVVSVAVGAWPRHFFDRFACPLAALLRACVRSPRAPHHRLAEWAGKGDY